MQANTPHKQALAADRNHRASHRQLAARLVVARPLKRWADAVLRRGGGEHETGSLSVAMTLDGYVAGPKGESDWIVMDPEIDFAALASSFDTMLLGRNTYEAARQQGGGPAYFRIRIKVKL